MTEKIGLDLAKQRTDEFHGGFGHMKNDTPTELTTEEVGVRVGFITEELVELLAAVSTNKDELYDLIDKFICDTVAVAEFKEVEKGFENRDRLVDIADALTDINVFVQGTFTMAGIEPQPLYDIVMDANMAKLGPDGKPILRESDGKIMKPEGWAENWAPEPKLKAEIERQKNK